jgi:hypothetical protein
MSVSMILIACFIAGFLGVALARSEGALVYLAFALFSPVLVPIWLGMQVANWSANTVEHLRVTAKSRGAAAHGISQPRSMRMRPMASSSAYLTAAQH